MRQRRKVDLFCKGLLRLGEQILGFYIIFVLYSLRLHLFKGGGFSLAQENCIFCKIIAKDVPSKIVYEDEGFLGFEDVNPFGPVSILVVPKEHVATIVDLEGRGNMLSGLMNIGIKLVKKYELDQRGFSFHINGGGVQEINHLHLKIGGGWENRTDDGYPQW